MIKIYMLRTSPKLLITLIVLLSGCATYAGYSLNQLYGAPSAQHRISDALAPQAMTYHNTVKPVIESRCVVCHACYDAPCQFKMSSPQGIDRGASKEKVYQGTRLLASAPSRLFIDAVDTEEWRNRGFNAVLNERIQTPVANTQVSVLARMLELKQKNPLPGHTILDDSWDFSLDRNQQCASIEEMTAYETNYPLWGMPYGLPKLSDSEYNIMMDWVRSGAPMSEAFAPSATELANVEKWEQFFNQSSLKHQLSSRYIYEHLFLSHLYFDDQKHPHFFRLIRSTTPPGEKAIEIASRRPFDDPNTSTFFYRLVQVQSTIVDKTHMPYALNDAKLASINELFINADYEVISLPSYDPKEAADPLTSFAQLPVYARYKFMIEEAQNTIMGFIKGPVCRGQLALNVINDHFWVFFVDPELVKNTALKNFYASQAKNLTLPAEKQSNALPVINWISYAKKQGRFLRAKNKFLANELANGAHLTTELVWDGNGTNPNATLTVFRHFDSSTVTQGLVGEPPKTAWVIDYSLLERIHYLLVAGFDVYGNFGHQLMTRMYMDFLRMEGESNFLSLLPTDVRHAELKNWYQGANQNLTEFIQGDINQFDQPSGINFVTNTPKLELYALLKQRLANVQSVRYTIDASALSNKAKQALHLIGSINGQSASIFPEVTFIAVEPDSAHSNSSSRLELFSLLRNSAHKNVSSLFSEASNRDHKNDNLTLTRGLVGSYPSAFWRVKESQLPELAIEAMHIKSEDDYRRLLDRYGVRRTTSDFWQFSDQLHQQYRINQPIEAGLFDFNRLQNR
ncbi:fatty acid cis/trans isomerase [Echinimonas agarilytica]|uniref:Fatty acid cis/trans isomerase n=1 Tax=Echinimonas agarilytica TaxID=1215918 RepID=A0AA42B7X9_9GAMM|nr:fatty acid cis/trans isomerase [Echinimonas agarilytica]MCM2679721.1 fatty acid cis/trans isomerase [Echinimonas agarilytica]